MAQRSQDCRVPALAPGSWSRKFEALPGQALRERSARPVATAVQEMRIRRLSMRATVKKVSRLTIHVK